MTYKGAIDEVKILENHPFMPVIFKPSLKKIAATLEMERPKELTLSEIETYANEHNYVLWTDEMSEKALALIKADRGRPKGEWKRMSDLPEDKDDRYECSRCGNVVHYKKRMDLYTFNSWCGRCGSNNNPNRYDER